MGSVVIVGAGRAGRSFATALAAAGWTVDLRHHDQIAAPIPPDADLLMLCVPDAAVAAVAASVPDPDVLVVHVAGSLTLEPLGDRPRRGSIHPLASLPDPDRGAAVLAAGTFFAVDSVGDDRNVIGQVVAALGGRSGYVPADRRTQYHAAASIASNHLVALLAQVERVANGAGLELDAFLPLVLATVENVAAVGPAAALTGPAARGDLATLAAHEAVLDPSDRARYRVWSDACRELAEQR